jgi:predicted PurR-regulated permease PerM
MAFLDTKRDRAAFLIFMLGLGLMYALWPFSTGLIGAPVLYIMLAPIYRGLHGRGGLKPGLAAGLVVLLGILLILGPGLSFLGVVANEAQDMASGVIRSPLLSRLRELRIGPYDVGAQIEAFGSSLVNWIGTSARSLSLVCFISFRLPRRPGGKSARSSPSQVGMPRSCATASRTSPSPR